MWGLYCGTNKRKNTPPYQNDVITKNCRSCQLSHAILLKKENLSKLESTVLALFEPHSWIEPHPLKYQAKMQFSCIYYVTICGQNPVLKYRTLGFK